MGGDPLSNTLWWITAAVLFFIIEIFTEGFFIIWFGGGALVAATVAKLGLSLEWQLGLFLAVSMVLVLSTKRLAFFFHGKRIELKTNVQALFGKEALVIWAIPENGSGQVKIGGDIWSARSIKNSPIPKGVTVRVVKVEGVHLMVRTLE